MYRLISQQNAPFTGGDTTVVLGRDSLCAVRLTDAGVSDRHAQIERRADGYYVRDLSSATGVRVNGQRVTEQRLAGGDEIALGGVKFTFEVAHEPPPERRAFDPLQSLAFTVVALLVVSQIALFVWIFSQPHPRRGRTDIVRGIRGQQREARAATNNAPQPLAPLPPTETVTTNTPVNEVLNRMLRITRVDRTDAADSVALRIQVKAQVGERKLEPAEASVGVQFFNAAGKPKDIQWLNIPADWENFSTRTLAVKLFEPPAQCTGFVIRTYYRKKLQDVYAMPATLASAS
jgi:pSer/pThr/pTyr-binding forkhead associated (FHA) protein